jgi:hypothetical protein
MQKVLRRILIIMVLIAGMQLCATAQENPDDIPPDPDAVPLDPGSWILVAAGVGYGVKKWRDSKQIPGGKTPDKF